jgi:hypothetical protein
MRNAGPCIQEKMLSKCLLLFPRAGRSFSTRHGFWEDCEETGLIICSVQGTAGPD